MEDSLAQKQGYLARTLALWQAALTDIRSVAEAERWGYRRRCTLQLQYLASRWQAGMMRRDDFIAIPDCPVQAALVNEACQAVCALLPPPNVAQAAYYLHSGKQAVVVLKQKALPAEALAELHTRAQALVPGLLEGLWLHFHPSAGKRLLADSGWHLLAGQALSQDDDGLWYGPAAFAQLLPGLHRQALAQAVSHLKPSPGHAVVDLYCGAGRSLRLFTEAGASALGVEAGGAAVACAGLNAPAAQVLRGNCLHRLPQVRAWWQAVPRPMRLAYVNPPRTGLEPEVLHYLAHEGQPSRLAYLSCSAGTLARDLAMLEAVGYAVECLTPYDFFPQTHHVEVLALLTLKPASV